MKVSPSILSCDFSILKEEIETVIPFIEYLHIDVMDGNFVPNITFGPRFVKNIREHFDCIFDVHLMVIEPLKFVEKFADYGSDIITFHYESKSDINETIKKIKSLNKQVGLSINPSTPVEKIIPYLHELDLVLVMSVEPGFGGQIFNESSLDKIKKLSTYKNEKNLNYLIEVDGGINADTVKLVKKAGADLVVAGSYIFNSKNREEKINSLK